MRFACLALVCVSSVSAFVSLASPCALQPSQLFAEEMTIGERARQRAKLLKDRSKYGVGPEGRFLGKAIGVGAKRGATSAKAGLTVTPSKATKAVKAAKGRGSPKSSEDLKAQLAKAQDELAAQKKKLAALINKGKR